MAFKTELVCKQQFEAYDKAYGVGDIVPADDYAVWPEGTLANRLNYGFVKYEAIEVPDEKPRKPKAPEPQAE